MSTIGRLLQAKEPLFDHALHQLELMTGQKGIDAKLAAEIAEKAANRIHRLGLHTSISGKDLYTALIERAKDDDVHLAITIGGQDPSNPHEMIPLIVKATQNASLPRDGWFLKEAKARELLKSMPPESVMERLGYHLVSHMLEQESVYELFLSLRFAESAEWLTEFTGQYRSLVADDFEKRTIRVMSLDRAKWGDIAESFVKQKHHNLTHSKEMGAIAIMPILDERIEGITLKVLPLLCHYFTEIRLYSSFFKLMRTKQDFGHIVADTLIADPTYMKLAGTGNIHWRVIQHYYGQSTNDKHPEIFEPHVQTEDLSWRRAEEVLYEIDPALDFWNGMDFVSVLKDEEAISFNLVDIGLSYSNGLEFSDRHLGHSRESLWNEVFVRYLGEETLENQLLFKFETTMMEPEKLKVRA